MTVVVHAIVEGEPGSTPWPVWRVTETVFGPVRRWLERREATGDEPVEEDPPGDDG